MAQNNNKKTPLDPRGQLPWDKQQGENLRLYIPVLLLLLLSLLLIILIRTITVEVPDRSQQPIPERLAQLVIERQQEAPPPPEPEPVAEPEPKPEAEPEPEPEQPKPEPKPEPRPEPTPRPDVSEEQRQEVRERMRSRLDDELGSSLAGLDDIGAAVDSGAGLRRGGAEATRAERDLIGRRASEGSGGVAVAQASSGGGGGGQLSAATVSEEKVESRIAQADKPASTTERTASGASKRTQEQLRRIFDRYAGQFNSQYQRALRSNPALQGSVDLQLEIAPSGEVVAVSIKSSQLNDTDLERRLLMVARRMDFGALNVETWKGSYRLNFFPG